MKLETAIKTLRRRGWTDIPTQDEADKMLATLRETSWVCQDGTYITREERAALRAIAAGEAQPRYYVTSRPGMTPYSRVNTIRQARKDAREARAQGLDGVIYTREGERAH